MNKIITLTLIYIGLMLSLNSYAATQYPLDRVEAEDPVNHNINDIIIKMNNDVLRQVGHVKLLLAENSHNQDANELNQEILEINQEMNEMGQEFKEEMVEMGKELKGLVKMLRKMGDKESSKGAFLGILLDEHKGVDEGVLLLGVTPNGPAQNAGLQADDVITSINQQSMAQDKDTNPASHLYKTMKTVKPGDKLTLFINRDGQEKKIIFDAGKRGDHLQSGINFLADDLEKRITKKIHIEMDDEALSGIELYPVNDKLGNYFGADNGMLILKIPENNKFKLQQGDVILKIGDRSPKSTSQTWRILESYDIGEKINLTLMRDHKEINISINKP